MKTKILYVLNYIVNGGPSNVVRELVANLDKNKYEVTLLNLFQESDPAVIEEFRNLGAKVLECKTLTRMGCLLGNDREFKKLVKKEQYDVIHTHGFIPDILSSRLKTKAIQVSTIHNNMFEDYLLTYGKWKSKVYIPIHIHALKKLDHPVCCSKSAYDVMKGRISELSYVRNGIQKQSTEQAICRSDLNIPENAQVYIYAGCLSKLKQITWMLQMFHQLHNEQEYIVVLGSGEEEKNCKAIEDDHIKMLGFQKDPISFMRISDVYISASCSEGFSISVLEALDQGLGLFLSDIPSHREVFEIDDSLYLGERFEKEEKSFAAALQRMRDNAARLNKRRIENFKEVFLSGKSMAEQYEQFYK